MRLSTTQRERLQEIAQEAREIVGESCHADGRPMTFAELEDECIEVGDLLTSAILQRRVRDRQAVEPAACCPSCDRVGDLHPDEPRVLQTDRGEVTWIEPTHYCRGCRRSFFPSFG